METVNDAASREKVWELIKDIRISMLVTTSEQGQMRSRPMAASQKEFDGSLWFFTGAHSGKVRDVTDNQQVLVVYSEPDDQNYVSIAGRAVIVRDRTKIHDLWSEPMRTWFPKGADDPEIALLRVDVDSAEYWDVPSSAMVYAYGYVKARLTGEAPSPGDVKHVNF